MDCHVLIILGAVCLLIILLLIINNLLKSDFCSNNYYNIACTSDPMDYFSWLSESKYKGSCSNGDGLAWHSNYGYISAVS